MDHLPSQEAAPLEILVAPHSALKTKAKPVAPEDRDQLYALVPRLFATMYKAPGIGLAAPQVGVGLRVAVVDVAPEGEAPAPMVLINPEIVAVGDAWVTREEGCLSLPNMYADVSRPADVRVAFTDMEGKRQEVAAEGLLAACLQHEIDHLDGILFVDHLSILKRNMIMRKLAKEMKQKTAK